MKAEENDKMALSMLGVGLQQMNQMVNQQVKQVAAQAGPAAGDPKDQVQIGGQPEPAPWKPFPPMGQFPGGFPMGGMQGPQAPAAPQQPPQTMEQADDAAADAIEQMVQLAAGRPERPQVASPTITNFAAQAIDHQLMICDMKGAQAIQRQTQLALGDKGVKLNNPKTQAALAKLGNRPIGAFCRQAAAQQKEILNGGGQPKPPTTQPSTQPAVPQAFTRPPAWF